MCSVHEQQHIIKKSHPIVNWAGNAQVKEIRVAVQALYSGRDHIENKNLGKVCLEKPAHNKVLLQKPVEVGTFPHITPHRYICLQRRVKERVIWAFDAGDSGAPDHRHWWVRATQE